MHISYDYSPQTYSDKPLYTVIFYMPHYFMLTRQISTLTGTATAEQKQQLSLTFNEVSINGRKCNAVLGGVFTATGATGGMPVGKQLVVATYHAPCVHKFPASQALHFENALKFVQDQKKPTILAGDMNTQPTDRGYRLLDGVHDVMFALHGKHLPTSCSPDMPPACLDYVFCNSLMRPKTLHVNAFHEHNNLSVAQPSDHGIVSASLQIVDYGTWYKK